MKINPINPEYYEGRDGKDRIQRWYEKYEFEHFRVAMLTHIDKYLDRYVRKNGIEDLMKAMEYIRRLAYYEELELAKAIKKAKLLT